MVFSSKFFTKFFHRHKFQRKSSCRWENFSQIWNLPFLNSRALNALNSNIECDDSFAVSFDDLQREFYKFHSLLGSVGELSGDKLQLSSPSLQSNLWNLLKSSRHVSSRNHGTFSKKREDPGNEVGILEPYVAERSCVKRVDCHLACTQNGTPSHLGNTK